MKFPFSLLLPRPPKPHEGPYYADIYPRALAAAIDLSLLFLFLSDLFHLVTERIFSRLDPAITGRMQNISGNAELLAVLLSPGFLSLWLLNAAFQLLVMGSLLVVSQTLWGWTPGKWLMGLKVVRAESLEPIMPWRHALRYVAYIPAILPLMIGIFWISFNKQRRGWHDYIAGTVVINTRPYEWYRDQLKALYRRYKQRRSGAVE